MNMPHPTRVWERIAIASPATTTSSPSTANERRSGRWRHLSILFCFALIAKNLSAISWPKNKGCKVVSELFLISQTHFCLKLSLIRLMEHCSDKPKCQFEILSVILTRNVQSGWARFRVPIFHPNGCRLRKPGPVNNWPSKIEGSIMRPTGPIPFRIWISIFNTIRHKEQLYVAHRWK